MTGKMSLTSQVYNQARHCPWTALLVFSSLCSFTDEVRVENWNHGVAMVNANWRLTVLDNAAIVYNSEIPWATKNV